MFSQARYSPRNEVEPRNRGFAVIIALSLMAFIVLLLLSMATLIRVESQTAQVTKETLEARQNALLGAMIAVGKLQRHAGPDQRVTTSTAFTYERDFPANGVVTQKHWTGVWTSQSLGGFETPRHLMWLVSGNENVDPEDPTYQQNTSSGIQTLLDAQPTLDNNVDPSTTGAAWLVHDGSASRQEDYVQAPLVSIDDGDGSFAWWVADEGVKARLNLAEPFAGLADPEMSVRIPTKLGVAGITGSGRSFDFSAFDAGESARLSDATELPLLDDVYATSDYDKELFHDLTAHSKGVLANVRDGGLKKDLTAGLRDGAGLNVLEAYHDAQIGFTGGQIFPPQGGGGSAPGEGNPGGPKWEQLKSYLDLADLVNGPVTSASVDQLQRFTDTQHGLHPVISQAQIFFDVHSRRIQDHPLPLGQFDGRAFQSLEGIDRRAFRFYVFPAVVLWNPYNVRITTDSPLYVRVLSSHGHDRNTGPARDDWDILIRGGPSTRTNPRSSASSWYGIYRLIFNQLTQNGFNGYPFSFQIPSGITFEPGQALVFSLGENQELKEPGDLDPSQNSNAADANVLSLGWNPGFSLHHDVSAYPLGEGSETFGVPPPVPPQRDLPGIRYADYRRQVGSQVDSNEDGASYALYWYELINNEKFFGFSGPINRRHANWELSTSPNFDQDASLQKLMNFRSFGVNFQGTFVTTSAYEFGLDVADPVSDANKSIPLYQRLRDSNGGSLPINVNELPRWGFKSILRGTFFSGDYASEAGSEGWNGIRWSSSLNPRAVFSNRTPYELEAAFSNNKAWLKENQFTSRSERRAHRVGDIYNIQGNGAEAFVGFSHLPSVTRSVMFQVPHPDTPIANIGELMHAQLFNYDGFDEASDTTNPDVRDIFSRTDFTYYHDSQLPAYTVGNSRTPLWLDPDTTFRRWSTDTNLSAQSNTNFSGVGGVLYDHSFLLNQELYDRYFFSTVPDDVQSRLNAGQSLPNSRMTFDPETLDVSELRDFSGAASQLMVAGGFNVNSGSVEAWQALLGSFLGQDPEDPGGVGSLDESPFARLLAPQQDAFNPLSDALDSSDAYAGYRTLTKREIQNLAEAIVAKLKERGEPFLSMSDFVNRSIVPTDPLEWKLSGFLQSAIDPVDPSSSNVSNASVWRGNDHDPDQLFNLNDTLIDADYYFSDRAAGGSWGGFGNYTFDSENPVYDEKALANFGGSTAEGIPGFLTQADLLSKLDSVLTTRSDTFKIRAYGESNNVLGGVDGRAWCELVVQRYPEYVDNSLTQQPDVEPSALNDINRQFGRKFRIISVKWLNEEDV